MLKSILILYSQAICTFKDLLVGVIIPSVHTGAKVIPSFLKYIQVFLNSHLHKFEMWLASLILHRKWQLQSA